MAMLLKRQYELVSLRVGLIPGTLGTRVRCVLERGVHGALKHVKSWTFGPEEFGLPERLGRRTSADDFKVPIKLARSVQSATANLATPDGVLWLHLQRPYGYLGLVPWESLSEPDRFIVLRLPDVLAPPPREAPEGLDLALCASSPVAKSQFELVRAVASFLQDAAAGMRRRVRAHVFADSNLFGQLSQSISQVETPNLVVKLHDPSAAQSYPVPLQESGVPEEVQGVRNPWLRWMRDTLQGRSLDVAHFIGHGYVAQERGAIALAESPLRNRDTEWARFVGYSELNAFLNQTGAWSVAFTTPSECRDDVGLRLLADQVGQQRPGSVLHHSAYFDPNWSGLMQAYAFLYAVEPATPRALPGVVMYCQPSRVARDQAFASFPDEETEASREVDVAFSTDDVPDWLAASQRFLEQAAFQARRSRNLNEVLKRGATGSVRSSDSYQSTLRDLQGVVARFTGFKGEKS